MGNRAFTFEKGNYYHVYNRGYNKQKLFFDERDYNHFLDAMILYRGKFLGIQIPIWCILPNHFHFLLFQEKEDSSNSKTPRVRTEFIENIEKADQISPFMQKLQQSYAAFFNAKYGKTIKMGLKSPVFEGRFQAREIIDEEYLAWLKTYIEYNPVKHELVSTPEEWKYSSLSSSNSKQPRVRTEEIGSSSKTSRVRTDSSFLSNFDPYFD